MTALVTGGTGLLGSALLQRLPGAVVLSRDPVRARRGPGVTRAFAWHAEREPVPEAALEGVDTIYHLAGDPVADGRWTAEKKRRIRNSRVLGTRHLVASLARLRRPPRVLVAASAIGYYGDRGDTTLDEAAPAGEGFLPEVCAAWEQEARAAEAFGVRVVSVRIGVVLAKGGGALARMLPPFRLGLGGHLGSGRQWMAWVHLDDVIELFLHASRSAELRGALNAVSPHPVTNREFTMALGRALHRPAILSVPRIALRLALGEMSEVLTDSARVLPRVAERSGYRFEYPHLDEALAAVLSDAAPALRPEQPGGEDVHPA